MDIEPAMLAGRGGARRDGPQVQTQSDEGDMSALPLEDRVADLCLSYGGLHCVGDPQAALAEMARCLRPGGRLVGSTFLVQGSSSSTAVAAESGTSVTSAPPTICGDGCARQACAT